MKKDCILLNKPFRGSYLYDDEHEAHEIISFFKTDEGNRFIYNNPYGQNVRNATNFDTRYMVYTSEMQGDRFYILYVCKIEKTLHNQSISKKKLSDLGYLKEVSTTATTEIINNLPEKYSKKLENVTYGNIPVTAFFHDDSYAIPLTFMVSEMYQAITPILIDTSAKANGIADPKSVYHFQRNYGCVQKKGKSGYVYQKIMEQIERIETNPNFKPYGDDTFNAKKYDQTSIEYRCLADRTFLDFIASTHLEEAYTKMIANLFNSVPGLFERFLNELPSKNVPIHFEEDGGELENEPSPKICYPVLSEKAIPSVGRLDLFYTNHDENAVIENKIDSLLTVNSKSQDGLESEADDEDKQEKKEMRGKDQLSRYHLHFSKYAKDGKKTLFLVLAPKNRLSILKQDMNNRNPELIKHYQFVGYGLLEEFFECHKKELENGEYRNYVNDALLLLKRLSLTDKERCEIKLAINAKKTPQLFAKAKK